MRSPSSSMAGAPRPQAQAPGRPARAASAASSPGVQQPRVAPRSRGLRSSGQLPGDRQLSVALGRLGCSAWHTRGQRVCACRRLSFLARDSCACGLQSLPAAASHVAVQELYNKMTHNHAEPAAYSDTPALHVHSQRSPAACDSMRQRCCEPHRQALPAASRAHAARAMTSALPHSRRHHTEPARSRAPNKHTPSPDQRRAERQCVQAKQAHRSSRSSR